LRLSFGAAGWPKFFAFFTVGRLLYFLLFSVVQGEGNPAGILPVECLSVDVASSRRCTRRKKRPLITSADNQENYHGTAKSAEPTAAGE
jgi:hypothetical protein